MTTLLRADFIVRSVPPQEGLIDLRRVVAVRRHCEDRSGLPFEGRCVVYLGADEGVLIEMSYEEFIGYWEQVVAAR